MNKKSEMFLDEEEGYLPCLHMLYNSRWIVAFSNEWLWWQLALEQERVWRKSGGMEYSSFHSEWISVVIMQRAING